MSEFDIYDHTFSVALRSSAGSGKTHALTTRLIAMLLAGIQPAEILAITFTNAAAADIRRKLFDRTLALERGDPRELVFFSKILREDPSLLPGKARRLKNMLIRQFSLLQISTIHAFFTGVLRSFPRETGLFSDLAVLDDLAKKRFLDESLELFFESVEGDRILMDRLSSFLLSSRDRGLRAERFVRDAYEHVRRLHYFLRDLFDSGGNPWEEFTAIREAILSGGLDERLEFLAGTISRILEERGPHKNLESFLRGIASFQAQRNVRNLADLTPFKRSVNYVESLYASLPPGDAEEFRNALVSVAGDLFSYLQAQMRAHVGMSLDVFRRVDRLYGERKSAVNAVDFTDIELHARDFFSSIDDFDYFDYRSGSGIRYVLVDEFQDTSALQWDALAPLVRRSLRRGGTLFYVGDVKQSIYRWRGGEPALFEKAASIMPVRRRSLSCSYRQNGVLLDFVNALFERLARDRVPGYAYERQHLPEGSEAGERGFVSIRPYGTREEVLAAIVESLEFLHESGVSNGDCAVLCRTNRDIGEVERVLAGKGIPFSSPGRSRLLADWAVADVLSALRFMLRPDEKIHAAALLRSPVFRASYGVLGEALERCADRDGFLLPERLKEATLFSGGFPGRLLSAGRYLNPSRALRLVFEELGLFELCPKKTEMLLELYELAWSFEGNAGNLTISDFLAFLDENSEELTAKTGKTQGVRLLTIHASKGLEFQSVIVPFLDQPFRFEPDGSLLVGKGGEERAIRYCLARSLYRDYFSRDGEYERLFEEADLNYRVDELNALYVALTRAKENLLVIPLVKGTRMTVGRVFADTWPEKENAAPRLVIGKPVPGTAGSTTAKGEVEKQVWESPAKNLKTAGRESQRGGDRRSYAPLHGGVTTKDAPVGLPEDTYGGARRAGVRERRTDLLKGLLVHKALEMVEGLPVEIGVLLDRALANVGAEFTRGERHDAASRARRSLRNVLEDGRAAKYFSRGALREVFSLSRRYGGGVGRIDGVFFGDRVEGDLVEIVDFKTNRIAGGKHIAELTELYRSQVHSYCVSVAEVFPEKRVRGELYFTDAPFDDRFVTVFEGGGK